MAEKRDAKFDAHRQRLANELIDGTLSDDELKWLLKEIGSDAAFQNEVEEVLRLHLDLIWRASGGIRAFGSEELLAFAIAEDSFDRSALVDSQQLYVSAAETESKWRKVGRSWPTLFALTASLAGVVLIAINSRPRGNDVAQSEIATTETRMASPDDALSTNAVAEFRRLVGCDLSIDVDSPAERVLESGRVVEFSQGAAEIRFSSGVTVVASGPIRMRINGAKALDLLYGNLSAKVEESGIGFRINTPKAEIIDLGTEFGVSTPIEGPSEVQVFSGMVDVAALDKPSVKLRLGEGEAATIRRHDIRKHAPDEPVRQIISSIDNPTYRLNAVQDSYIEGGVSKNNNYGGHPLLLVKRDEREAIYNRKAYVEFDLSELEINRIVGARLTFTISPNRVAEEKHPDNQTADCFWKFEVGGVWNRFSSRWSHSDISWLNAPAHNPNAVTGQLLGPEAPTRVGRFQVYRHGTYGEQVSISGSALVDFLRARESDRITFEMIARLTGYTWSKLDGLEEDRVVHSFASQEHGRLAPPLLELWCE